MFKKILHIIPTGSITLTLTSVVSYGLGMMRDRFFAHTFGASRALDAYNAAFLFPDLLFNVLIAGGIVAAFVPIFSELMQEDRRKADTYTHAILTAATTTMTATALVVVIFAKPISMIVAPGFSPEEHLLVAKILRILAFSPLFFAASNVIGSILIVERRFLYYGLSPVLYNVGIIFGTVFLASHFGILGVAYGTIIGAALHLCVRLFDVMQRGLRFKFSYAFKTTEFTKTVKLMVPKMLGHPVELVTFWGFTAIASTLSTGSVAILNFARNFQSFSVSLIGITIATTSFPLLASAANKKDHREFFMLLRESSVTITLLSTASALIIFFIRTPLIEIFLGGGAFQSDAIHTTATMLGIFCLSIPTESMTHLLSRAFYATKNTVIPVTVSIFCMIASVGCGYLFSASHGILAIPWAFFLGSALKVVLLGSLLPQQSKKVAMISHAAIRQ